MNIEQAADEVLVYQLDIARQSIQDRDKLIFALQTRVELLENMLNRAAIQRTGVPAPQPQTQPLPRRWAVR